MAAGHTSPTLASFDTGTSGSSPVTISGGTIVLRNAGTGASGPRDYRNSAGIQNITGGTLQLGDASSGIAKNFQLTGVMPDLVITNTSAAHLATLQAQSFFSQRDHQHEQFPHHQRLPPWVDGASRQQRLLVGTAAQ
jgi:hypothetical protein